MNKGYVTKSKLVYTCPVEDKEKETSNFEIDYYYTDDPDYHIVINCDCGYSHRVLN